VNGWWIEFRESQPQSMNVFRDRSVRTVMNSKLDVLSLLKRLAIRVNRALVHPQVHSVLADDGSYSAVLIESRQRSSHGAMPFPISNWREQSTVQCPR
jgi:hypothetical protein